MNNNARQVFTLKNRLCAVSAFNREQTIYATDGITDFVYLVDSCGDIECERLLRNYRALRFNENLDAYTAICSQRSVYFLTAGLCEYAKITLESSRGCLCDASALTVNGTERILGAFDRYAAIFDADGRELYRVCETDCDEIIEGFICFGPDRYAMISRKGSNQLLTIYDRSEKQSEMVSRDTNLRMLYLANGVIYGLFGRNYLYNEVYPIYSCGNLRLPAIENRMNFC